MFSKNLPYPKVRFPLSPWERSAYLRLLQAVLHTNADIRFSLCSALLVDPSLRPFAEEEERRALANLLSKAVGVPYQLQHWLADQIGADLAATVDYQKYRRQWVKQMVASLEERTFWINKPFEKSLCTSL